MSDPKMQVIFVKQTGHVLAAFNRTADDSKSKIEDVVGAGLPFRNMLIIDALGAAAGGEFVVFPPEALDVASVDFNEDTFLMPLNFVTSGSKVDQLGSVTLPVPTLTASQITITVSLAVPDKTKVLAVVQQVTPAPGQEPLRRVVEGEIASGASNIALDLKSMPDKPPASIVPGKYDVLVLVAGRLRHFVRKDVP